MSWKEGDLQDKRMVAEREEPELARHHDEAGQAISHSHHSSTMVPTVSPPPGTRSSIPAMKARAATRKGLVGQSLIRLPCDTGKLRRTLEPPHSHPSSMLRNGINILLWQLTCNTVCLL